MPLPLIDAVAAVYGLLKMISLAGFPALIPQLVDDGQLSRANALEGASYGLASLTGAGLAGLVIGAFGHEGAIGLVARRRDQLPGLRGAAAHGQAAPDS